MEKLIEVQNKNYDLEFDLKTFRHESEKSLQSFTKLNDFEFKFVKMLARQKGSNDKCGIGYNNAKLNYKSRTIFVKCSHTGLLASIVAKNNILSLHVPTDVTLTILSTIPFLMNYVSK